MWTILKFDKKNLHTLKKDFLKKLGNDCIIYIPKICLQKKNKNKLIKKEFNLLGDYLFCFHKKLENQNIVNSLKFSSGLKYFLGGFMSSQDEIKNFINKCHKSESIDGYLSQDFFEININSKYKFSSGPFTDTIFKILSLQKNKINILMGNIKTTIRKKDFLFQPI